MSDFSIKGPFVEYKTAEGEEIVYPLDDLLFNYPGRMANFFPTDLQLYRSVVGAKEYDDIFMPAFTHWVKEGKPHGYMKKRK